MHVPKDLMAAAMGPLVLSILSRREAYGYDLVRLIREASGGHLKCRDGMIYQVLHRLNKRGWVRSKRTLVKKTVLRIYYYLTPAGKRVLNDQLKPWALIYLTLKRINPKALAEE